MRYLKKFESTSDIVNAAEVLEDICQWVHDKWLDDDIIYSVSTGGRLGSIYVVVYMRATSYTSDQMDELESDITMCMERFKKFYPKSIYRIESGETYGYEFDERCYRVLSICNIYGERNGEI